MRILQNAPHRLHTQIVPAPGVNVHGGHASLVQFGQEQKAVLV